MVNYLLLLPIFLLLMPAYMYGLAIVAVCYPAFCFLWSKLVKKYPLPKQSPMRRKTLCFSAEIAFVLLFLFLARWTDSSKLHRLASMLKTTPDNLSLIAGIFLSVVSIPAIGRILYMAITLVKQYGAAGHINANIRRIGIPVLLLLFDNLILLVGCLQGPKYVSNFVYGITGYFGHFLLFLPLNFLLLEVLNRALSLFLPGRRLASTASGILVLVLSVVNHYVVLFHGSPLLPSELQNAKTALEVVSGYSIRPDMVILLLIVLFHWRCCCVGAVENNRIGTKERIRSGAFLAAFVTLLFGAEFGLGLNRVSLISWSWIESVAKSGYPVCAVQDGFHMVRKYVEPDGYDVESLPMAQPSSQKPEQYPDIVLILNESFSDLADVYRINTDVDPMENYYGIQGAVYGNAIACGIGGMTNNSEFELLTSHSIYLVNGAAPFNFVDFSEMRSHNVGYLKNAGYRTMAFHCAEEKNYHRNVAYPAIGFDDVFLGGINFTPQDYGNRAWLDSYNYRDLISRFDPDSKQPQFLYLLTYQNHGGYTQNGSELDTVHVQGQYGDNTEELNEYLTSVRLSADAFRELTEYFSACSRPVIVCMVGDHQPSFAPDLPLPGMSDWEKEFARRTVPYAVWSNYDVDFSGIPETVSMTDIVPSVLAAAGFPLSTYMRTMLEVQRAVPLRNQTGLMGDSKGEYFLFQKGCPYYDRINELFCMEYNALKAGENYREDLFMPAVE